MINVGFFPRLLIAAVSLLAQGCATPPSRLPAVPSELTAKAEIPGPKLSGPALGAAFRF